MRSILRFIMLIMVLLSVSNSFAQQKGNPNNEQTIFIKAQTNQEVTLAVDLTKYDLNTIGQLKDDLFQFQYAGKISSILLDEFKKILTIKYNEKFLESDFTRVFYENNVSFLKKDKLDANVSE
ncbi:MAG: hypothetical protein HS119_05360 [Flavobacteriales bacterium]|nr:hypothetical protein [Flavobacteriales bacterium]